jgi:RNA polymerase sigma-70 factor, ECF subfamily
VLSRIEACIPALRRYAHALLRDPQDADDLVHDTLVRALGRLHTRRDEGEIRSWLFAIMHNLFVSQVRRAKVRAAFDSRDTASQAVQGGQEQPLRWTELLRTLNCLPEEQRVVLLLVSVEDLSYTEVARVLGIPIGTVMSRLARGRERLRQLTQERAETRPSIRRVK